MPFQLVFLCSPKVVSSIMVYVSGVQAVVYYLHVVVNFLWLFINIYSAWQYFTHALTLSPALSEAGQQSTMINIQIRTGRSSYQFLLFPEVKFTANEQE